MREIARRISRDPSTISRELNRNTPPLFRRYTPHLAQERYEKRKQTVRQRPRLKDTRIIKYVQRQLKLGWSPEQIAGRWSKLHKNLTISHKAIYQYIYVSTKPGGQGDLRVYLRRRHKRRQRKYILFKEPKTTIPNRISIDLRPKEVNQRKTYGHWEGDSIISRKSKVSLNTLAERKSRLVRISKLTHKTVIETRQAVVDRLWKYPEKLRQTLTLDNGTENAGHEKIN